MKSKFELIAALAQRGAEKCDSYWPGELRSILDQITNVLDEAYIANPDTKAV